MQIPITLAFISILAASSARFLPSSQGKIIGGSDANRAQFPYMISVRYEGRLWCGGTLVSKTWIVSAAHCYEEPEQQSDLIVVAGLLHIDDTYPDVQVVPVAQVVNHPEYIHLVAKTIANDISLLKLASPLTFTETVRPAALPPPQETPSGEAWLSGWGLVGFPEKNPSTLQCLEMPIITNEECDELFTKVPQFYPVLDSMVCVAPPTLNETGCYGDSGGPLAQNGIFLGVTSFGSAGCGLPNAPTVFTRVSNYIDFIYEHIKDD